MTTDELDLLPPASPIASPIVIPPHRFEQPELPAGTVWDALRGVVQLDLETFSEVSIDIGASAYAQHPTTGVYVACLLYHVRGQPGRSRRYWFPGQPLPPEFVDFLRGGGVVVAFNAAFEKSVWRWILSVRHGWPELPPAGRWRDVQAMAASVNLPLSLDAVGVACKFRSPKDEAGHRLMLQMCAPLGKARPAKFDRNGHRIGRLALYCMRDVEATAEGFDVLPLLGGAELQAWIADCEINERGVFLDDQFAANIQALATVRRQQLVERGYVASGGVLDKPNSVPALKAFLKSRGVAVPTVRVKTDEGWREREKLDLDAITGLLAGKLPPDVREVLDTRLEARKVTSLAKAARVSELRGADGRYRFGLRWSVALTGRWAGGDFQLHNLPRPEFPKEQKGAPSFAELVRMCILLCDADGLDALHAAHGIRPLSALSASLRSVVRAAPGFEFIGADYSAIEARGVCWLAGQQDVLDQFARGEDVYTAAANASGSTNRQFGKVQVLQLGYGAGAPRFQLAAAGPPYFVNLTRKQAKQTVTSWRARNSAIVKLWEACANAARDAIQQPGRVFFAGDRNRLAFLSDRKCLRMRLPSGRIVHYWQPSVVRKVKTFTVFNDEGDVEQIERVVDAVVFYSPKGKTMQPEEAYGGLLVENAVQAICRDLLAAALARFRSLESSKPYRIVLHVHDSAVAEVPRGAGDVREFEAIMAATPPWAEGFPVAAEGLRSDRFKG